MTNITQATTYIFDMLNLAQQIEDEFVGVLPPYQDGWYLPNKEVPAIRKGGTYFVRGEDKQERPFTKPEDLDIVSNVFDTDGEMVVPWRNFTMLTPRPTLPYNGMRIIKAIVNNLIDGSFAKKAYVQSSLTDAIVNVIYGNTADVPNHIQYFAERVADMAIDLRTDLVNFIGKDKWAMYHVRPLGHTGLIIERGQDFRIMDWERRMASGEWKNE
jgi:hypothetical protein